MEILIIVSWTATLLGFGLKLSPIVMFYKIAVGKESIEIVPEMLIICNLLCPELWFSYWNKQDQMAPWVSSLSSLILGYIFSIIYLFYFSEKKIFKFLLYILLETCFVFGLYYFLSYIVEDLSIIGSVASVVNIITYISPGQKIIRVIKEKNYKLIPIVTTILGCITSSCWLYFGIALSDVKVIVPNFLSTFFSALNSFIWFYFYCKVKKEEKNKTEKDENEVEMVENKDEEANDNKIKIKN